MSVTHTEHTAVASAPTQIGVRRGDVVGERYEIRGRLRDDAFSHGFLALDQESEEQVLLRVIRAELLETADRNAVLRALRRFVGVGGRFLPGLLDADRDGPFVYATEPVPTGVSFRDVLDGRLRTGKPLEPNELLPLIGHLDAALGAIPSSMRHGDVQASLVWVDRDRLELTGAFFVAALPMGAVATVLQRHGDLRRRYAPELLQGIGGPAADRFGVGAIAHEALTLKPPPPPGESVSPSLGALAEPLAALLHPDLAKRGRSLEPLIETLSRLCGHPPIELDPGPFRVNRQMRPQRPSSVPPAPGASAPVSVAAADGAPVAPPAVDMPPRVTAETPEPMPQSAEKLPRRGRTSHVPGLDDLRTERLPVFAATTAALKPTTAALTKTKTTPPLAEATDPPTETGEAARAVAPRATPPRESALDPRLVRAAAAEITLEPLVVSERKAYESAHHLSELVTVSKAAFEPAGDLDPPLVRAAFGLGSAPPAGDEASLDPGAPTESREQPAQALRHEDLEDGDDEVPLDPSVPAQPRKEPTQELRLEDLEAEDDEVSLDPSVPAQPRREPTQELRLEDLEAETGKDLHPPTFDGTQNLSLAELEHMAAEHRRAAVPADVKPVPRPRRDSTPPAVRLPALFDDGASDRPRAPALAPVPVVNKAALNPNATSTNPGARRFAREARPRRGSVLWVAIGVGVAIILGSFAYAAWRRDQAEEARRQRLLERFQQLQRAE